MKNAFRQATGLMAVFMEQNGDFYHLGIVTPDGQVARSQGKMRRVCETLARYFSTCRGTSVQVVSSYPLIAVNPACIKDVGSAGERMIFTLHDSARVFSVNHAHAREADINSCRVYNGISLANNANHALPVLSSLTAEDRAIVALHLKNLKPI